MLCREASQFKELKLHWNLCGYQVIKWRKPKGGGGFRRWIVLNMIKDEFVLKQLIIWSQKHRIRTIWDRVISYYIFRLTYRGHTVCGMQYNLRALGHIYKSWTQNFDTWIGTRFLTKRRAQALFFFFFLIFFSHNFFTKTNFYSF